MKVPHLSEKGEQLLKSCVEKIRRCFKKYVKFNILYDDKKQSMFCSSKENIPINQNSNIVYTSTHVQDAIRPIFEKQTCFLTRMKEYGTKTDQSLHQHLTNCEAFQELCNLFTLPDLNKL